jgi:hypothetical protein
MAFVTAGTKTCVTAKTSDTPWLGWTKSNRSVAFASLKFSEP